MLNDFWGVLTKKKREISKGGRRGDDHACQHCDPYSASSVGTSWNSFSSSFSVFKELFLLEREISNSCFTSDWSKTKKMKMKRPWNKKHLVFTKLNKVIGIYFLVEQRVKLPQEIFSVSVYGYNLLKSYFKCLQAFLSHTSYYKR